jgi:hypothetical protein
MTQMFEMAKAAITGTKPEVDAGEHGSINL